MPSNMAAKTTFCLYLVKLLIVTLRCTLNVNTLSFPHFSYKICVQKEVIHNFKKKSHFGHVTSYELIHFKKMVRVWKTKWLLFCLRYDPLIVFRRQNDINFIFIKTMSHDLLVQMFYCSKSSRQSLSILKIVSSNWKKKDNVSEDTKENCAS